ncbi:MAG: sugar ABC transporter permease [Propionibacteriaceae bacterium]|jgi:multiple sugar transport system permease protein/raffinose/stachyose/melibiose transport system permease protein|nr:sugar ABC transporter permease [Propionibacteriaceae bacterium]
MSQITESAGGGAAPPSPAATSKTEARPKRRDPRQGLEIAVLSGPAIVVFVTFVIVPVFVALYYGFFSWKGYGPATNFVGLDNYKWTLTNPDFWDSVRHTGTIAVLSLLLQGPLAIVLALLMNQKMRGRSVIRVLIFVPYVISEAVVGTGFNLMLQDAGAVNALLHKLGFDGTVSWISSPKVALWTLMFVITWKYIGFAVILLLAGLQGIPEELSEAASVDGATYWQIQRHIMLPLLTPTIKIWAFLSLIGSMQLFDLVYIIWGQYIAGTAGTSTMVYFMTQNGRLSGQLGRGSAIAIIVFVISLFVSLLYQRFVLNRDTAGALTEKEG